MTASLVQLDNLWSKNRLANEYGIDRRTIDNLIKDVPPSGVKGSHPAWLLRDVAPAISKYYIAGMSEGEDDPERMLPKDRKDWYEGEQKRIQILKTEGGLLVAEDARKEWAELLKKIMLTLDTLVDVVERDVGLERLQISRIQEIIDGAREALYNQICMQTQDK